MFQLSQSSQLNVESGQGAAQVLKQHRHQRRFGNVRQVFGERVQVHVNVAERRKVALVRNTEKVSVSSNIFKKNSSRITM